MRLARQCIGSGMEDPDALSMAGFTIALLAGEHAIGLNAIERALALKSQPHARLECLRLGAAAREPRRSRRRVERAMRLSPIEPLGYRSKTKLALAGRPLRTPRADRRRQTMGCPIDRASSRPDDRSPRIRGGELHAPADPPRTCRWPAQVRRAGSVSCPPRWVAALLHPAPRSRACAASPRRSCRPFQPGRRRRSPICARSEICQLASGCGRGFEPSVKRASRNGAGSTSVGSPVTRSAASLPAPGPIPKP